MYAHVCLLEQVFSNSVDIWSGWCFLPLPARHQEHSFGGDSRRDLHCQMTPEHGNLVTKLPQLRTSKRFPRFHNIKINKILHTKAEWWLNYFLNVIKYKLSTNLLSLYLSYTTALIFFFSHCYMPSGAQHNDLFTYRWHDLLFLHFCMVWVGFLGI